ncbi:RNA methyltransferase [Chania multitudinisentens RB-25]|uniref:tRNA (cytidine/uridine-2'-O-)-methyltransferase TrmJ n=1 Tax=Chania multitudinisentens RB-25 TaxID=1441930 RepID=W0LFE2_9GAMM|nr:tRNA/rRNA methyltransferase [Chania multitudinisentens]AHG21114.1 RNA methyltransferase [Chania multitudinisentens RB-25]
MQIHIVLVAPARPENVGAAARAMKTMGFTSLRIVDSEAHSQPAARWVAYGAGEILDAVQVFPSLQQALADVDFTVATTARSRARFHYYCTPQQLTEQLAERQHWVQQVALVFGREDSGLTNEELALADLLTGVPMVADYPSLNLGQAVMVYCYQLAELMQISVAQERSADIGQLKALRQRADRLLHLLAVSDDQKLRDWLHQRLGVLQQRDTVMLHTLLHDIEKKLIK